MTSRFTPEGSAGKPGDEADVETIRALIAALREPGAVNRAYADALVERLVAALADLGAVPAADAAMAVIRALQEPGDIDARFAEDTIRSLKAFVTQLPEEAAHDGESNRGSAFDGRKIAIYDSEITVLPEPPTPI